MVTSPFIQEIGGRIGKSQGFQETSQRKCNTWRHLGGLYNLNLSTDGKRGILAI